MLSQYSIWTLNLHSVSAPSALPEPGFIVPNHGPSSGSSHASLLPLSGLYLVTRPPALHLTPSLSLPSTPTVSQCSPFYLLPAVGRGQNLKHVVFIFFAYNDFYFFSIIAGLQCSFNWLLPQAVMQVADVAGIRSCHGYGVG